MSDTIFAKIIAREIPAEIIYEDDYTLVIPDKFPSMYGQLLVISKRQVPYIYDLPDEEYESLMQTVKRTALALDKALGTVRTCIIVEGFEVPHVHVRLYPCIENKMVTEPRAEASNETLKNLADKIRSVI